MPDTAIQWTDTITVNTNTANTQSGPRIIQLENGDIIVAWATDDPADLGSPAGYDIMAQRYDQGGNAIGEEFRLNNNWATDNELNVSLVNIPGAGFLSVYEDQATATSIRLENYNTDGTLNSISALVFDGNAAPENYQNSEVAASSATSALIIYEKLVLGGSSIAAKLYNPSIGSNGSEISVLSGSTLTDPSISVLSNGNYVIVATETGGDDAIFMRILDSTGANILSSTEISFTASNGYDDAGARVEALTGGGFVVAWEVLNGGDRDIVFRTFNADGTANGPTSSFPQPGNTSDQNYTDLHITALSDGGFAILADNDRDSNLHLQRFNSNSNRIGTLIEIDDLDESEVDITLLADGRMAMVYSNGADIKMQIFDTRDASTAGASNLGIGTAGDDVMVETTTGFGDGVFAGAGNDNVFVTTVANNTDVFDGGTGIDTLSVQITAPAHGTSIDLLAGTRTQTSAPSVVDTIRNFENATGANGDDALYGTNGANVLTGNDGNDVLWGRAGADTLIGGAGDDTYLVDDLGDIVTESVSEGTDIVYTSVDFTLGENIEIGVNNASGTAGSTLSGNTLDNVLIMGNTVATGASTVNTGAGNDTVYVQNNTTVNGESGIDAIVMNGNNNTALGGANDDVYIVLGTGNVVTEAGGQGQDTVYSYAATFTLSDNVETLALITFDANFAQNGTGNTEANTLIGSGSNNILSGLGGGDFLIGGGGDDILVGGTGLDVMQGNVGNDVFLYNSFGELGDIIQDWVNTDDSFHFSGLAFGIGVGASLTNGVNFISSTAPTSVAAQATFLWDSDDYDLYYDGDGTGTGLSAVLVASLQDFTTVDVTDFVFF